MNYMEEWAKREIELACKRERGDKDPNEWDYGVACYESAYKAFKSLMEDEHSGCSIGLTMSILKRLVQCKPLTLIEDSPDIWHEAGFVNPGLVKNLQCSRMTSFWKNIYPDGTINYIDNSRVVAYCIDRPTVGWHNGMIIHLIHEMFPITMPYYPASTPYKVYIYEGLTDPKNGDWDTTAVLYVITPDGERVEINRYFDDTADTDVTDGTREITKEEYQEREKRFVNQDHEKFVIA